VPYHAPFHFAALIPLPQTIIGCMALFNSTADILTEFSWSVGTAKRHTSAAEVRMYVGLTGFAQVEARHHESYVGDHFDHEQSAVSQDHSWNAACPGTSNHTGSSTYCLQCQKAAWGVWVSVALAQVFSIPAMFITCRRMNKATDDNVQKTIGCFGGFLGGILDSTALLIYSCGCANNLPTEIEALNPAYGNWGSVQWRWGTGFFCMTAAASMLLLGGLLHLLVPSCSQEQEQENKERKPLLCGEAKQQPCAQPREYDTEHAKTGCCN